MKLSTSLFAVAMAQYDYDDFTTTTEEAQTTPLSFDPSVSFDFNFLQIFIFRPLPLVSYQSISCSTKNKLNFLVSQRREFRPLRS